MLHLCDCRRRRSRVSSSSYCLCGSEWCDDCGCLGGGVWTCQLLLEVLHFACGGPHFLCCVVSQTCRDIVRTVEEYEGNTVAELASDMPDGFLGPVGWEGKMVVGRRDFDGCLLHNEIHMLIDLL